MSDEIVDITDGPKRLNFQQLEIGQGFDYDGSIWTKVSLSEAENYLSGLKRSFVPEEQVSTLKKRGW